MDNLLNNDISPKLFLRKYKFQIFLLALIVLALPLTYYLSKQPVRIKPKAAPTDASLSLVPTGVTQDGSGNWQFPLNQNVSVNVVLQTTATQADMVQSQINYNPNLLRVNSITCNVSSTPHFYNLTAKYPAVTTATGEYRDPNGIIKNATTNAEVGKLDFSCVPFDPPNPTPPSSWPRPIWVPVQTNTRVTIATISFTTLQQSSTANSMNFSFTLNNKNDTNVTEYIAYNISNPAVTSSSDILGSVNNINYLVGSSPTSTPTPTTPVPTATRTPTPSPTTGVPTPTTPVVSPTGTCPRKSVGDANCDGNVNISDFGIWRSEFTGSTQTKQADYNGDGNVNISDFGIWRTTFVNGG